MIYFLLVFLSIVLSYVLGKYFERARCIDIVVDAERIQARIIQAGSPRKVPEARRILLLLEKMHEEIKN